VSARRASLTASWPPVRAAILEPGEAALSRVADRRVRRSPTPSIIARPPLFNNGPLEGFRHQQPADRAGARFRWGSRPVCGKVQCTSCVRVGQVMTRQRIRRGVCRSIVDLQAAIHLREEALDRVDAGRRGRAAVYARPLACTQMPGCASNASSSMIAALSISIVRAVVSTLGELGPRRACVVALPDCNRSRYCELDPENETVG
jgi:hypothetical protein